jgi:diacylglycerol kinase (ATP)
VLAAEASNSALEALANRVAPDHHPLVARAKDLAASAVLLAALAAASVGVFVLGPPLLARLLDG